MKLSAIVTTFFLFSSVIAENYIFSPIGDNLKVMIDQRAFAIDFFDSFTYWKDYSGPYNYDGYTDLSIAAGFASGIQAASLDQKKCFFYAFLTPEERLPSRVHELQSIQEQYINYLAAVNNIVFFDLPGDRSSSVYPPDFWSNNYKENYPLPSKGRCKHPDFGAGNWYLHFWKHDNGKVSLLLAISYEQKDQQAWFSSVMKMIKKR